MLAISGSTRKASSNTALLHALAMAAPVGIEMILFDGTLRLPVFSPDLEGEQTPDSIALAHASYRGDDSGLHLPRGAKAANTTGQLIRMLPQHRTSQDKQHFPRYARGPNLPAVRVYAITTLERSPRP